MKFLRLDNLQNLLREISQVDADFHPDGVLGQQIQQEHALLKAVRGQSQSMGHLFSARDAFGQILDGIRHRR